MKFFTNIRWVKKVHNFVKLHWLVNKMLCNPHSTQYVRTSTIFTNLYLYSQSRTFRRRREIQILLILSCCIKIENFFLEW